jgi:hypothetical protein
MMYRITLSLKQHDSLFIIHHHLVQGIIASGIAPEICFSYFYWAENSIHFFCDFPKKKDFSSRINSVKSHYIILKLLYYILMYARMGNYGLYTFILRLEWDLIS